MTQDGFLLVAPQDGWNRQGGSMLEASPETPPASVLVGNT